MPKKGYVERVNVSLRIPLKTWRRMREDEVTFGLDMGDVVTNLYRQLDNIFAVRRTRRKKQGDLFEE